MTDASMYADFAHDAALTARRPSGLRKHYASISLLPPFDGVARFEQLDAVIPVILP